MGIQLRNLNSLVNMEQVFALLLVSVALALGQDSNNCADISTYSDVTYNLTISKLCHYTTEKRCEPRSKRLCINTPNTECHIEAFTECHSTPTIDTYRNDKTKTETFLPKKCKQSGVRVFEEVKNEAVCKTETKKVCDRVYDTDSVTGRQIEVLSEKIVMIKNMKTVNLSQVLSRQRFHNMNVLMTPPSHMYSPFSWNFLSQLTKQNANQKLFQFVSQLKRIPVML